MEKKSPLFPLIFQQCQRDFDGFQKLFARFLQDVGPSVDWSKIQPLPDSAVNDFTFFSSPNSCSKSLVI